MASKTKKDDDVVLVDFAFRRELAKKVEGNLASFCYQCGACVGDCPSTKYGSDFNPREIMLKVLYGLGEELLGEGTNLWECTNCYNCAERCPQDVKPAEVIISLKNMLTDRDGAPEAANKVVETFYDCGRTVKESPAVDRLREKYGLPPLIPVPMEELKSILAPLEDEGEAQ